MSKKDWKKQILRMKQLADQNLGRSEKSEVLTDDLQLLERQMNQIKDALQIIVKKLQACLIPYSGEADKRLRKLPEYALSSSFGDLAVTFNNETVFGKLFGLCSEAEMFVARSLVHCTIDIEAKVIQPAQILLERDIPAILKLRKQLANMTLDMDSAKSRHQALCKQTQNTTSSVRLDAAREEFEEAEAKVEHCKDVFATEMYSFFAREEELCKMLLSLLESQSAYHQHSIDTLDRLIPLMREEIELTAARPVFGCSLEEHLRHSKREIASVIEDCVAEIIKRGLDVEGIFRIAPAASKVKELKAAFDANMVDVDEFEDIHCFCASLKHYLRELPQPIMTFELYNEWLQACQRPPNERLNALWVVVDKLPKFNYMNLRYVIKFLAKVTEQSDVNKMNATNLGIVIGPNLLWPPGENRSNVQHTSSVALIAEALIGSSEWFFPGDVDFPSAGSSSLNASSSSSSDVSLQKSQAKFTFLAGNQSNSSSTALKTSSSAGSLLEQSSVLESKLTETVSYNVFKPPKKVKGAARAASPAPPGSEHKRSASISLLASNVSTTMKETTALGAVKQDDATDRKAAASARPRFPPPARPAQPQLDKANILLQPLFPDKPKNSVTRHEQADGALAHSQSSSSCDRISENDMLEIPENASRKLVSRSLEDFVSESKHGEKYRSVHGDSCFESEKSSNAREGSNHHHHHQTSGTSSDCALDSASGFSSSRVDSQTRGTFCLDERAAAEEVLPRFKPSVPTSSPESDSRESDAMKTSITSVSSVRSIDGNMSNLPLGASNSFIQGVPLHRKDFVDNDSSENRLQYVKGVCVSVEPPTPESSNHQNKELRVEPEPSFVDKGNNATSAMKNKSKTGQFMVYEDSLQRSFQSLLADNGSNFARIENQLEANSARKELAQGSGVTVVRSQCNKEVASGKDILVDRGNVQVESKSGFSIGEYEDRSKAECDRSERSTVPFEARRQVNVVSKKDVIEASGTTERCNVQIMTHKDCDKIANIKSDNLNAARVAVQLENSLGKQDESYKNKNENQLKEGGCTNVIRQQDIRESNSAKFSSTSSATNSGVSGDCNTTTVSSNASPSNLDSCGTEGPSNTGYGPPGTVAPSSQAKQSDHKEMIQSLKLFFLSDKPPEMSPRGRSNSAVDCFRPGAGSELLQQSTESTRQEGGLTTRRSAGTLATGSQSECGRLSSSSSHTSAARFSSSSTDISSNRAYANASPREKFFESANPSAPVLYPSLVPEARGTEGTARSERSGVPPPSPARRSHPSDSGNESATARRSKEDSSNIVEDTRL